MDKDGIVWYSDFAAQWAGYMNPKTGEMHDIAIPVLKPEQPKGNLEIEFRPTSQKERLARDDVSGRHYPHRPRHQGSEGITWLPEGLAVAHSTQASMVSPQHSEVDGQGLDQATRNTTTCIAWT